jgi:hypothetical protein
MIISRFAYRERWPRPGSRTMASLTPGYLTSESEYAARRAATRPGLAVCRRGRLSNLMVRYMAVPQGLPSKSRAMATMEGNYEGNYGTKCRRWCPVQHPAAQFSRASMRKTALNADSLHRQGSEMQKSAFSRATMGQMATMESDRAPFCINPTGAALLCGANARAAPDSRAARAPSPMAQC